jgi:hypothetical protein
MPLTLRSLIDNGLLDELASCFTREADAYLLLTAFGFPPGRRPNFNKADSSLDFWYKIGEEIDNGVVADGFEQLLSRAAARLPGNKIFAPFVPRQRGGNPADTARPSNTPPYIETIGRGYDVFLSLSSADREKVKEIRQALQQRGVQSWMDEWDLPVGEASSTEIEGILSTVKTVAVFYGTNGYGPWQRAEVDIALERSLRDQCLLIPVMLPGVAPTDLPGFLRRLNGVRIADTVQIGDQDIVIDRLARAILEQRRTTSS